MKVDVIMGPSLWQPASLEPSWQCRYTSASSSRNTSTTSLTISCVSWCEKRKERDIFIKKKNLPRHWSVHSKLHIPLTHALLYQYPSPPPDCAAVSGYVTGLCALLFAGPPLSLVRALALHFTINPKSSSIALHHQTKRTTHWRQESFVMDYSIAAVLLHLCICISPQLGGVKCVGIQRVPSLYPSLSLSPHPPPASWRSSHHPHSRTLALSHLHTLPRSPIHSPAYTRIRTHTPPTHHTTPQTPLDCILFA